MRRPTGVFGKNRSTGSGKESLDNDSLAFKSIVFDLDGTLLVSNIDFASLRIRLQVPNHEAILDWVESREEEEREAGRALLHSVEREAALDSRVHSGVPELLDWLRARGVRFGILTRNSRTSWNIVASRFPFLSPDLVVTREEAPPKPLPACLQPFLDRWNLEPSDLVHVGDYRFDLELAQATGMHSILINAEGKNPYPVPCDHVVRDLEELLVYLRTLPFFEEC